jgi:Neuraminidase (sialidase)
MFTSSNNIVIEFWDGTYGNVHRAENKETLDSMEITPVMLIAR